MYVYKYVHDQNYTWRLADHPRPTVGFLFREKIKVRTNEGYEMLINNATFIQFMNNPPS